MSSPPPATPTRRASPANLDTVDVNPEDQTTSPQVLTPGRKIKAMMAAFEDDSDSESEIRTERTAKRDGNANANANTNSENNYDGDNNNNDEEDAEDEDEEEDIVMPKGRMASRMQAGSESTVAATTEGTTAFERVSRMFREEERGKEEDDNGLGLGTGEQGNDKEGVLEGEQQEEDEDDDLPTAGRRKRPAMEDNQESRRSPARSVSPLFMPLPSASATRRDDVDRDLSEGEGDGEDEASAEDEEAPKAGGNARFLALVAQKRKEREEKERAEAEQKAARRQQMEQFSSEVLSGEDSGDEGGSARKLTQQVRPGRKASKKALEEMHRETQRMSRNMQLTHQMQTRKKIPKESLFARFNFMQPEASTSANQPAESSSTAGSQPSSDVEGQKGRDTPPTSPVVGPEKYSMPDGADKQAPSDANAVEEPANLPTLDQLMSEPQPEPEQPIVGRVETETPAPDPATLKSTKERKPLTTGPVRVRLSRESIAQQQKDKDDSDDDLEVVTSPGKCRRYAAFENLPARRAQESPAMMKLKALAHLTSPNRKSTMNSAELSASLLSRARQQAAQERRERIQELRNKGIAVETSAERAAMEDTVEDLVERARKEGEEIARKERKAAKQKGQTDEDDEDDDYELSGSEEEAYGDGEDEDEDDEEEGQGENGEDGYVENEAGEADESEDGEPDAMSENEAEAPTQRKRPTRVISDDEDDEEPQVPSTPAKQITPALGSVERPQFPDLPGSNGLTMGLTQAFAGTLGDNEVGSQEGSTIPHTLPDPAPSSHTQGGGSQVLVKDSQEHRNEPTDLLAGYPWPEARVSESPAHQFSQAPEPTQDAGFVLSPFDPSKRFMDTPTSTIETVLVSQNQQHESPKKGRLLKRGQAPRLSVIEEDQEGDFEINASAFDVMKKASKKPAVPFDKQNSKAKEAVEDAAEESDDEYAGLGGGSDDSEDEENAYDQEMINDNSGETVDEKQLAALNAVHDRAADEKQVAKLLKDINSGALRRRRGGDDDLDLDDSDDERLARRRQKQREFARMRKALLADETVGEIADNPKKAAFFKAIEDHNSDDEVGLEFLDEKDQGSQEESSQDVTSEAQQDSGVNENNKRKRPLEPSAEDIANRPPPHFRRKPASAMSKKPTSLAEIRETVSFLTETPEYDSFHEDASIEEDVVMETEERETPEEPPADNVEMPFPTTNPRRTRPRGPVIDRLALLRQASSNSANCASANTRLTFHAGAGSNNDIGFRPPSFAKRASATSASSGTTTSSNDSSHRPSKAGSSGTNVSKTGAVNYYTAAREKEREKELRVRQRSRGSNIAALLGKHAENRLGAFGGGNWE